LTIDPNDVVPISNKGLALYKLGDYNQSLAWFDKALSIDPNYVESMIGIGLDYDKLDNPAKAREWFNKALGADPNIANSLANTRLALSNSTQYQDVVVWLDRLLLTDVTN
jgi:tetratricopeptide (TPR) repeat protein